MQDTMGFIWVATEAEGLMRYDGEKFESINALLKDNKKIGSSSYYNRGYNFSNG